MQWRAALTGAALASGLAVSTAAVRPQPVANADAPPLAYTGGFGEPTCHECHFEASLNPPGGTLGIDGLPARFEPGASYRIHIALAGDGMTRAGFQAAIRYADSPQAGIQAGMLEAIDEFVDVRTDPTSGVLYAHHSRAGTELQTDGVAGWTFAWTAPALPGRVVLHVAANSANGDDSPLSDYVYTAEARTDAANPDPPAR